MPLARQYYPDPRVCLQYKASRFFTCAYIDPTTCEPTRNMTFGSSDDVQSWNEGPPPFPGWWNAHHNLSQSTVLDIWRWWDGEQWSAAVMADFNDGSIEIRASTRAKLSDNLYAAIKWNDRWPVGARVPRLIPEGHPLECYAGMIGGTVAESSPQLSLPLDDKPLQQQLEESDW